MCVWCQQGGYWECDGEGGHCFPPFDGRPDEVAPDAPPIEVPAGGTPEMVCEQPDRGGHWEVHCEDVPLKYRGGRVVEGAGGEPVLVCIDGTPKPKYRVELNRHEVPETRDEPICGSKPPYRDPPRNRKWDINTVVELRERGSEDPVLDKDGNKVRVRVQSYLYDRDNEHPPTHPEGRGPKVRFYALRPNQGNCDPADPT
jgi:hypothetical protein